VRCSAIKPLKKYIPLIVVFLTLGSALVAHAVTDADLDAAARREAMTQERRYGVDRDPALNARVQAVFNRVAAASAPTRWPLRVAILDNPQPNAFSLPNGQVFVNRGLFALRPTDDELGFVLAHEIAHVCREHVKSTMDMVESIRGRVSKSWMTGASRANETQADLDGVAAVYWAGYDPQAALDFLAKMGSLDRYNPQAASPNSDHPVTGERMLNVQQLLAQHPEWLGRGPAAMGAAPPLTR
jgi:predicted Zn-dependent protease